MRSSKTAPKFGTKSLGKAFTLKVGSVVVVKNAYYSDYDGD
jgi:hypothetical protein